MTNAQRTATARLTNECRSLGRERISDFGMAQKSILSGYELSLKVGREGICQ
jgi:hypothetical protein